MDAGSQEANNVERMEAMFKSQLEKSSGIYSFTLNKLNSGASYGKLPFLSASALNEIRREIARRLEMAGQAGHDKRRPVRLATKKGGVAKPVMRIMSLPA